MLFNNDQAGQSLIELVIALALLASAIIGSARLISSSVRASSEAGRRTQASTLATREFEAFRNFRDRQESVGANPFGSLSPTSCEEFIMQRNVATGAWNPVIVSAPQGYTQSEEGVSDDEFRQFRPFSRQIELCPSQAYVPDSGPMGTFVTSGDVRHIRVVVQWREDENPASPIRDVEFSTILTDWEHD